jgi:hypothetical protein
MVGNWLARLLLANKLLGLLVDFPIPNLDWPFLGHPVQRHQQHHHSTRLIFFLEYAGELRIFVLRRRNMVPYKHRLLTPDRAVRGC